MLANSAPEWVGILIGHRYSIDDIVRTCVWIGLGFVYVGLVYLTFVHRWRPTSSTSQLEAGP